MYATTRQFLDYFNLKSLDQLPALAEIRDLETLNAELGFSEPLAVQGGEQAPGLSVVGGTDHFPAGEHQADAAASVSQAANALASLANPDDYESDNEDEIGDSPAIDGYPDTGPTTPESQA
jgi:segregation and condensation protein B